ncbi:hypothetical protein [uncultured Oscillibacter sp.]|uniref:hypothetical protein n=1 Tax=uncultured Oscillibacter sp. TaxID=876091 RepID=UPI0025CE54E6|nr:hypothetical protein [uncultured Oscillibacter sp.]
MRRSFTLLLASLLLVFTLTACGRDDKQDGTAGNQPATEDAGNNAGDGLLENGPADNGPADNGPADNGGTLGGDVGDTVTNGMDDVEDGLRDAGDALTGNGTVNKTRSPAPGVSYEQMLRNARVHDRDGDLTDHENAVTPGAAY